MFAHKDLRGLVHFLRVKRPPHPTRFAVHHWRAHRMVENPVLVSAAQRIKTCVKARGNFAGPLHGDVVRQKSIDAANPTGFSSSKGRRDTHHLMRGMHASIRATGTDRGNGNGKESAQGVLKDILHRIAFGLRLPAEIIAAVVLDAERNALHGLRRIQTIRHGYRHRSGRAFRKPDGAALRCPRASLREALDGLRAKHRRQCMCAP